MSWEAGVFPREDTTLIRDELFQERDVLEIECVEGEIDFGFRAWGAGFHGPTAAITAFALRGFFRVRFARHSGYLISR